MTIAVLLIILCLLHIAPRFVGKCIWDIPPNLRASYLSNRLSWCPSEPISYDVRVDDITCMRRYNVPFFDVQRKVLFCWIPKVACSKFKLLFRRMLNDSKWQSYTSETVHFLHMDKMYRNVTIHNISTWFNSSDWTRVLFVRDPIERFISAYLDKVVRLNVSYQANPTDLERFVDGKMWRYFLPDHFISQTCFCGLHLTGVRAWNVVGIYSKSTIGDTSYELLKMLNLTSYYFGWDKGNTLFGSFTHHATHNSSRILNRSTCMKLMTWMKVDYDVLPIAAPSCDRLDAI